MDAIGGAVELAGGSWTFETIGGTPVIAGEAAPALVFGHDGRISGTTGINRISATYRLEGDRLSFGPAAITRMAGSPEMAAQETAVTSALSKTSIVRIEGDRLSLDHGDSVSTLRAGGISEPDAEPAPERAEASPEWGAAKTFALVAAAIGWYGLILQFVILLSRVDDLGLPAYTGAIRFFSYFTILSNVLAAVSLTVAAIGAATPFGRWLNRPVPQAGVFMYIGVTGLVYTFVLARVWDPQGWDLVADSLLHYVMPALFVVHWVAFRPHGTLEVGHIPRWLAFPTAYGLYSMVRGPFVDWYPYFFLDVDAMGYPSVLAAIVALAIGFAVLGFAVVGLDSFLGDRRA